MHLFKAILIASVAVLATADEPHVMGPELDNDHRIPGSVSGNVMHLLLSNYQNWMHGQFRPQVHHDLEMVYFSTSHLNTSFNCSGRAYGYYADVDSGCKLFHLCVNYASWLSKAIYGDLAHRVTFKCDDHLLFHQANLTCAAPAVNFNCTDAVMKYDVSNLAFAEAHQKLTEELKEDAIKAEAAPAEEDTPKGESKRSINATQAESKRAPPPQPIPAEEPEDAAETQQLLAVMDENGQIHYLPVDGATMKQVMEGASMEEAQMEALEQDEVLVNVDEFGKLSEAENKAEFKAEEQQSEADKVEREVRDIRQKWEEFVTEVYNNFN